MKTVYRDSGGGRSAAGQISGKIPEQGAEEFSSYKMMRKKEHYPQREEGSRQRSWYQEMRSGFSFPMRPLRNFQSFSFLRRRESFL